MEILFSTTARYFSKYQFVGDNPNYIAISKVLKQFPEIVLSPETVRIALASIGSVDYGPTCRVTPRYSLTDSRIWFLILQIEGDVFEGLDQALFHYTPRAAEIQSSEGLEEEFRCCQLDQRDKERCTDELIIARNVTILGNEILSKCPVDSLTWTETSVENIDAAAERLVEAANAAAERAAAERHVVAYNKKSPMIG